MPIYIEEHTFNHGISGSVAAALINAIDFDVDPCDNFYDFACGNWIRSRTIPEDKSGYDQFTEIRDSVTLQLRGTPTVSLSRAYMSKAIGLVRRWVQHVN